MEESLLPKSSNNKTTWRILTDEMKKLGFIAGPMVAVTLSQYLLQVISVMMVGHLGELSLSSTSIAISLSSVTGFSLIVSSLSHAHFLYVFIVYMYMYKLFHLVCFKFGLFV